MKPFLKHFAIAVPWATAIFLVFVIGLETVGIVGPRTRLLLNGELK